MSKTDACVHCVVKSITWTQGRTSMRSSSNEECSPSYLRITVSWCKDHDVPVEKLFSKTLLNKCTLQIYSFCEPVLTLA